jgi:SAM-dependent methyltransferase
MSVLDVGCGAGDVSLIAAELVTGSGRVVGFDRDARQVSAAGDRCRDLPAVSFIEASIEDPPEGRFDAIVGRLVLMYQPDLDAAVSSLIRRLRPGGVVAFVEMNHQPGNGQLIIWPPSPLFEQVRGWMNIGFASTHDFVGLRLPSIFRRAGLVPQPPYESGAMMDEGREFAEMTAALIRSMLPTLTAAGVDPADIDIDTLAERLYDDGGDDQIAAVGPLTGVSAMRPV